MDSELQMHIVKTWRHVNTYKWWGVGRRLWQRYGSWWRWRQHFRVFSHAHATKYLEEV